MIQICREHLQQISHHGEETYPEECCGLLLGTLEQDLKMVTQVWKTENSWSEGSAASFADSLNLKQKKRSKRNSFTIAPEVMVEAQKFAHHHHLSIIGIYHSHPDYPATPSEFDREIAWSIYSYLIVSVFQGVSVELLSWMIDDNHQFQSESILIGCVDNLAP